jgi:hypothetical protein
VPDDRHRQRRQGEGEGDRREPLEHAHGRQDGDRRSGRRRRLEQPWVEGFHRVCRVPQWTATALGIWWVEIRFRKAQ